MSSEQHQQQVFMSSSTYPHIWYLILDSTNGQPYKGTTADCVSLPSSAFVAQFRDFVKKKDKDEGDAAILAPFKSSQLLVYKNKAAFVGGKEEPLEEDSFVDDLGKSKKGALIVVGTIIKDYR